MNWIRIVKSKKNQPKQGSYKEWKELIAKEGFNQCIYCAIHDAPLGGIRNFHVEHYKPKALFPGLENSFYNLFYACPICNAFKGDDWPGNPKKDHSTASYPNPARVDYGTLFDIDKSLMIIRGKHVASQYLIHKLHLNRTQLILARREHYAAEKTTEICGWIEQIVEVLMEDDSAKARFYLSQLLLKSSRILSLKTELHKHSPYTTAQTR
jgi:5-methylcytosine-specific restriction endonuclease McrA